MTINPQKAMHILKLLSEEYEKTKDPSVAEKIMLLVENELSGEYSDSPRAAKIRIYNALGFLAVVPYFVNKAIAKSPFKVYWELEKQLQKEKLKEDGERLMSLYSLEAPKIIKSSSQHQRYILEEDYMNAVIWYVGLLCRSIALADESLGKIIISKPLLNDKENNHINDCANHLKSAAMYAIHIARSDSDGRFPEHVDLQNSRYIKHLAGTYTSNNMTTDIFDNNEYDATERMAHIPILKDILDERIHQITKHGYSEAHDDEHTDGSIADAAAHYASTKDDTGLWPWDTEYDKKSTKTRRDQLITSISMLVAEVERLDRAEAEVATKIQGGSNE